MNTVAADIVELILVPGYQTVKEERVDVVGIILTSQ